MKTLDNDFLELLRLLKHVMHKGQTQQGVELERFLKIARKQTVDGLLFDLPQLSLPKDDKRRLQLLGNLMVLERHNQWMDVQVAELAKRLDDSGVRFAIMKGQTCAAYYNNPLHRRAGDVDVYVVPDHFERANELLVKWGCKLTDKTMLHSTYQHGKLVIEVHFAVQKLQYVPYYERLKQFTAQEFDSAKNDVFVNIGGYDVRVLPDELNILLLTTHAFNHVITAGLGLRQVIDWQVVLAAKAESLNWEKLLGFLDALHLRKMFLVLAHINVCYLGIDETIFSNQNLDIKAKGIKKMAVNLLSWIEVCGNFGHSMNLGTGKEYFIRYYGLFLVNLIRFFSLNPKEMLAWPWMKAYRAITHKNHL